jgi:uncharacterized protein
MASCTIAIRLKPRAKGNRISVASSGLCDMAVTSPPVDNAANEHCIRLLAESLGVPKSGIRLIRGGHSKNKVVAVEELTLEEAMMRLGKVG